MAMTSGERDLEAWYRRYNAVCNAHRFEELGQFVAGDVEVNGEVQGLSGYVAGLEGVIEAFPDYRWEMQHLFVGEDWVSAHFFDTGTYTGAFLGVTATGRRIRTQEFAVYRVHVGRITQVWVAADNLHLLDQLR
jgi:predicted ester cyclase